MSRAGFSLIEFLVVVALFGGLALMMGKAIKQSNNSLADQKGIMELRSDSLKALRYIRRLGRISQGCAPEDIGVGKPVLECAVDFENPPIGNLTGVRFRLDDYVSPSELWVQREEGGNYVTHLRFRGVKDFKFCGVTELKAPATCTIGNIGPSFYANLDPASDTTANGGRYFLFEVTSPPTNKFAADIHYTSAFYARNPFGDVLYRWNQ